MMKTEQLNTSPTKQNTPPLCTMEKQDQRHFLYSHSGQEEIRFFSSVITLDYLMTQKIVQGHKNGYK